MIELAALVRCLDVLNSVEARSNVTIQLKVCSRRLLQHLLERDLGLLTEIAAPYHHITLERLESVGILLVEIMQFVGEVFPA
jgi:hypothetical protein